MLASLKAGSNQRANGTKPAFCIFRLAKQSTLHLAEGTLPTVSNVIRTNELQVWFIAEHLLALAVVTADAE